MKFPIPPAVLAGLAGAGFCFLCLLVWFQPDTRAVLLPVIVSILATAFGVQKSAAGRGADGGEEDKQ